VTYEVRVGSGIVHATVARGEISVAPGPAPAPDLVVNARPDFATSSPAFSMSLRAGHREPK
jgi:hypothetical protein